MPALGEIDPGGGQAKEFSRDKESAAFTQPRYSPDGDFLMYKKTVPTSSSRAELVRSKLVDIGKLETTIATSQSIGGPINEADYSPDGRWIAFESWPSTHDIFIMTSNGSNKRPLTSGGSFNFDAAWRPILQP